MSDTEIRMMRYTIEQLSAELQATRQYVCDMESKLERTRKALHVAIHRLNQIAEHDCDQGCMYVAQNALEQITALEQKDVK